MTTIRLRSLLLLVVALTACTTGGRPDLSGMSFSDEPLIGKFVWYDLVTEDAEAARRFYGGLFGWSFEETTGAAGNPYILARHAGVYVGGLVPTDRRPDGQRISRWLPYISVADVDASVTRSAALGGRVAVAPRDVGLGRVAAIIDPQGAVIGLARSSIGDPDDATTRGAAGRVVWTELLAYEHTAAASFYVDVVGFQASVIERRGGEYILLQSGGADRGGVLQNPAEGWNPAWLTYFGVSDPAAAAARAESLGGRVLLTPSPDVREGTIAIVADPSGAILALQKWPT